MFCQDVSGALLKKCAFYLWHHNQTKGQAKQDHVDAVHPPQEDEIRSNWRAKVTWGNKNGVQQKAGEVIVRPRYLELFNKPCALIQHPELRKPEPTLNLFDFHLPRNARSLEVFTVPLKLHPFLQNIWGGGEENHHIDNIMNNTNLWFPTFISMTL